MQQKAQLCFLLTWAFIGAASAAVPLASLPPPLAVVTAPGAQRSDTPGPAVSPGNATSAIEPGRRRTLFVVNTVPFHLEVVAGLLHILRPLHEAGKRNSNNSSSHDSNDPHSTNQNSSGNDSSLATSELHGGGQRRISSIFSSVFSWKSRGRTIQHVGRGDSSSGMNSDDGGWEVRVFLHPETLVNGPLEFRFSEWLDNGLTAMIQQYPNSWAATYSDAVLFVSPEYSSHYVHHYLRSAKPRLVIHIVHNADNNALTKLVPPVLSAELNSSAAAHDSGNADAAGQSGDSPSLVPLLQQLDPVDPSTSTGQVSAEDVVGQLNPRGEKKARVGGGGQGAGKHGGVDHSEGGKHRRKGGKHARHDRQKRLLLGGGATGIDVDSSSNSSIVVHSAGSNPAAHTRWILDRSSGRTEDGTAAKVGGGGAHPTRHTLDTGREVATAAAADRGRARMLANANVPGAPIIHVLALSQHVAAYAQEQLKHPVGWFMPVRPAFKDAAEAAAAIQRAPVPGSAPKTGAVAAPQAAADTAAPAAVSGARSDVNSSSSENNGSRVISGGGEGHVRRSLASDSGCFGGERCRGRSLLVDENSTATDSSTDCSRFSGACPVKQTIQYIGFGSSSDVRFSACSAVDHCCPYLGFAIQGKMEPARRNYTSVWEQLGSAVTQLGQDDCRLRLQLVGSSGSAEASPAPLLRNLTQTHRNLAFKDYFAVLAGSAALLPVLPAHSAYLDRKISSSVLASLSTGVPMLVETSFVTAYPEIDPGALYVQDADEPLSAALLRIASMACCEHAAKRARVHALRDSLNTRSTAVLLELIQQA